MSKYRKAVEDARNMGFSPTYFVKGCGVDVYVCQLWAHPEMVFLEEPNGGNFVEISDDRQITWDGLR